MIATTANMIVLMPIFCGHNQIPFIHLSNLINKLEQEDIDIDQMIDLFNQGMNLTKLCEQKLNDAEKKINKLLKKKDK